MTNTSRLAVLSLIVLAATAACEEIFPKPLDARTPNANVDAGADAEPPAKVTEPPELPITTNIGFVPLSTGPLTQPVEVGTLAGRLYVAEQIGTIRIIDANGGTGAVVLDLGDRVTHGFDEGILGFTFHPQFPLKPYLYVTYTTPHPANPANVMFQCVAARYTSSDGGLTFDRATEKRLLVLDHPGPHHNFNSVNFGPDGYLYITSGDGFDPKDLYGHGQKTDELLGKILRIDVDNGDPYSIPPTNPFASGGGRPEIYAYGFRNPWRLNFDTKSGRLFVGDVGEHRYEEINEVFLGANYGWPIKEGLGCFEDGTTCDGGTYVDPLIVHHHVVMRAIVGGVVYHGTEIPELTGKYVYSDSSGGTFWAAPTDFSTPPERIYNFPPLYGVSIRLDESGNIIVADFERDRVVRMVRKGP